MKLLYEKEKDNTGEYIFTEFDIKVFRPRGVKWFIDGENKSLKTLLVRVYFQAITRDKARIVYGKTKNQELLHTSYVIAKCYKFPFLNKEDYEIGPCFTYPRFRGKGIYPKVLQYITRNMGTERTTFYMIVDKKNQSSIRGIEKAGFEQVDTVKKTRFLKRYCTIGEKCNKKHTINCDGKGEE